MQRLFTTFPNSWPGAGLLLLRLTLAAAIFLQHPHPVGSVALIVALDAVEVLIGSLLTIGLWTPLACVAQLVLEIHSIVTGAGAIRSSVLYSATYVSLAALGPGAWSLDARLFGRKKMYIEP
jgi:uncharacterized membrane protein YphA (DoxX/SURF4 family)